MDGWETHRWDCKAVGNSRHHRSCGTQRWGFDVRSYIIIDDHGCHGIQRRIHDLEHGQRLGKITRVFHFRHESEEGDVCD